jgi:hypothetical protein
MDTSHIEAINKKMTPDSYSIPNIPKADYGKRPGYCGSSCFLSLGYGNYTQYPYVFPEFLFEDVYANKIVAKVVSDMLGPRPQLRWINGNLV